MYIERIIGIMGAMPEEINGIVSLLSDREEVSLGRRTYHAGYMHGVRVVVVFSRWGKVAAAATVATLIQRFHITQLIFTGVAGAIGHHIHIGDVVIGNSLVQHDMDARPLFARFEIPLLGHTKFTSSHQNIHLAERSAKKFIENISGYISRDELSKFNIDKPAIHIGEIASGDKFFATQKDKDALLEVLPRILCVEMEGAAVAQVCYEYDIPFTIIRIISDGSDESAEIDFPEFIREVSSKYAVGIIGNIFTFSASSVPR